MSINPLNDISRVYLEQVAESSHLENDMDDRHEKNEKAIKDMKKTKGYKDMAAAARKKMEEGLDPVGQEDSDIDNDGDTDKSDRYLRNRRKAVGKAIAKKKGMKEGFSNWRQDLSEVINDVENNKKIKEKKVENKITINPKLNEALEEIGGTLLEMVEIDEFDFIVESAYNELLEEGYEENDIEEALEFALTEAKVTFGHDTPTTEKKRESLLGAARKKLSGIKKAAKQAVATGARKVAKGALGVARKMEGGDTKPSPAQTKTRSASTYRGAGVGQKERVSSGSYTPPAKKKAEKPSDPWEGSATTPTKAKAKKAAAPKAKTPATPASKRKRKSKLDDLLANVRNEETSVERIDRIAREKVTQRAAAAKKEKEDKTKSASAFQAHKKEVLAKGGRPVDALDSWQKKQMKKEEVQIDEKITAKTDMGAAIKDFYTSKSPQLAGRTKEERRKAAIAAVLTARRGGRKLGEQMSGMIGSGEPVSSQKPEIDKKQQMLDKTKLANLKMLQQKKQQLDRQKLQMQKSGKLPLEAD